MHNHLVYVDNKNDRYDILFGLGEKSEIQHYKIHNDGSIAVIYENQGSGLICYHTYTYDLYI